MERFEQDKFTITQADPNVTASTATAAKMTEIYRFVVPRGTELKIQPHDEISMYLKDASAEAVNTDSWELAIEDANRLTKKIIASGIYLEAKEFQDHNKTKKIGATHYVRAGILSRQTLGIDSMVSTIAGYAGTDFLENLVERRLVQLYALKKGLALPMEGEKH